MLVAKNELSENRSPACVCVCFFHPSRTIMGMHRVIWKDKPMHTFVRLVIEFFFLPELTRSRLFYAREQGHGQWECVVKLSSYSKWWRAAFSARNRGSKTLFLVGARVCVRLTAAKRKKQGSTRSCPLFSTGEPYSGWRFSEPGWPYVWWPHFLITLPGGPRR